ncbi:MAG: ABC transporter substrate-binding protein [Bacillota bacterium]|nr:ABC transporter substrate-binding protein [Bacillota bacterium]
MNKKRIALLLALVLLTTGILVACGGEKTPTEPETPTETGKETTETPTEPAAPADDESVESVEKFADADTLVVSAPELNGSYINGFGNSTYDVWGKKIIGNYGYDLGYATIFSDDAGEWVINPTVVDGEIETVENADGSKTFTTTIKDGLVWNDGTPITAKDYVFGWFFAATPEWMLTGANNSAGSDYVVGFDEFHSGETRVFEGVNLIDDNTFSITVKAEKLPYFFELSYVSSGPTPIHRYAPNLDIVGNELVVKEGYEVSEEDKAALLKAQQYKIDDLQKVYDDELASYTEDESYEQFNKDNIANYEALLADYEAAIADENTDPDYAYMLELYKDVEDAKAVLAGYEDGSKELEPLEMLLTASANDVAYSYRFAPDVTCGPYNFVSFGNNMAKFTINDKFVGDKDGRKPTIKNVIIQTVNTSLDVDLTIAGTVDFAQGVIEGSKIDKALAASDKVSTTSYPRNGYGLLNIINDMNATQYKGVRQAIAYSLDRNEFVQTIAGGYGKVINGAFGINEFEYLEKGDEFEEAALNYTLNTDLANEALDTTPYLYEADGTTPWDPAKAEEMYNADKDNFDYWRHDENGNKLLVVHESGSKEVGEVIAAQLPDNTKRVGMQYIFKPVDFATLLNHYYYPDHSDPTAPTVFNMGTGFGSPHDNFYSYHSSQIDVGDNMNRVNDPELDKILEDARYVSGDDTEAWLDGWLKFNLWFNENLPNLPLYANEYYDIYTNRVKNVNTTPMWDWANIITQMELAN